MKAAPEAEDAVRWWCCPLRSLVLVLAVLLASLYTVTIAAASVIWLLHAQAGDHTAGTVVEVSSQQPGDYTGRINYHSIDCDYDYE